MEFFLEYQILCHAYMQLHNIQYFNIIDLKNGVDCNHHLAIVPNIGNLFQNNKRIQDKSQIRVLSSL